MRRNILAAKQAPLPAKVVGLLSLVGVIAVLVAVITAATPGQHSQHRARASAHPTRRTFHASSSDVKGYASLQQLRQDATAVAVLKPTMTTRIETIQGAPFMLTTVTVVQTISGTTLPASFVLRQTGDGKEPSSPVVSSAKMYLAYLQPFEFQPGVPIRGQYVVIGDLQGLFEQVGGPSAPTPAGAAAATFARVDQEATALPSTVTVHDAANS